MAPKQLFATPTRPTKRRKTAKTPKRKVHTMQVVPLETKRLDADLGVPTSGYVSKELFDLPEGVNNNERNGNMITARSIKVKYDLSVGQTTAGTKPSSLLLVRDNEPNATVPNNSATWQARLFADPLHDDWSMNLRNIDNTDRFQILRAVHFDPNEFLSGHGATSKGYFEIKLNQKLKFPLAEGTSLDKPTNVTYFLVYWSGDATNNDSPTVRYRLEWVDN